jgi:hypothetical protein
MAHNDKAGGGRGRARGWSWPRTLNKWLMYELTKLASWYCRISVFPWLEHQR